MRLSLGSHYSSYHSDSFQGTDKSKECPLPEKKKKTNNISFSLSMCRMGRLLGMNGVNKWTPVKGISIQNALGFLCFPNALGIVPPPLYVSAVIPRLQWSWRPEECLPRCSFS